MSERIAVYPGSFDPITNGHIDIIERGQKVFDKIIVATLKNPSKTHLFPLKERMSIIEQIFADNKKIEVDFFEGLLVDYLEKKNAFIVVRGLRAISDFETEFQMALMNRQLKNNIETFFMVPSAHYNFVSSRLVKEVYKLGGDIQELVPPIVDRKLKEVYGKEEQGI